MLYGQYAVLLNKEKTLKLPKRFSNELEENLFITRGFDQNLVIMSEEAFTELYSRLTSNITITDPLARLLMRFFLGDAIALPAKASLEINLSDSLCRYAKLEAETAAILVGQGDHFELWAQPCWDEQDIIINDAQKNADRFASLNYSI